MQLIVSPRGLFKPRYQRGAHIAVSNAWGYQGRKTQQKKLKDAQYCTRKYTATPILIEIFKY
jgi:hypothetical protein